MKQVKNTTETLSGFTPGKWEFKRTSKSVLAPFVITGKNEVSVCTVKWGIGVNVPETFEECEANAALIAAAPDLLRENEELTRKCKDLIANETLQEILLDKVKAENEELRQALHNIVDYLEWSESFMVEDEEEGNENAYTSAKKLLNRK